MKKNMVGLAIVGTLLMFSCTDEIVKVENIKVENVDDKIDEVGKVDSNTVAVDSVLLKVDSVVEGIAE